MLLLNRSRRWVSVLMGAAVAVSLASCDGTTPEQLITDQITTDQYEAVAKVTYTWQVQYSPNLGGDRKPRLEQFGSTSLTNRNGVRPDDAVTGPDDRGLWYPALPPRPTVDEMEDRQKSSSEEMSPPELLKDAEYSIAYSAPGEMRTLPTNYQAYRQAVRAYADQRPLLLTLGLRNGSILKAEPK